MKTIEQINLEKPSYSRLTAISTSNKKAGNRARYVNCIFSCGNKKEVLVSEIVSGGTKSCGCAAVDNLLQRNTKYVNNVHEINVCYLDMIIRCYDKECKNYRFYGAKGVIVCDEWKNDYQKFLDWALNNGWAKGLQLDKDINGNGKLYSPECCLWVTGKVNLLATGNRIRNKQGKFCVS